MRIIGVAGVGNIVLANNLTINHAGTPGLAIHTSMSGAFDVTKNDGGTLTFDRANTYSGLTTVNAGTLTLSATGSINNTSGVHLGGGTEADLGNVSGTLTLGSATLTLVQLGTYTLGDKFTLFSYDEIDDIDGTFNGLANNTGFTGAGGEWRINHFDGQAGLNGGAGNFHVTITAIPDGRPPPCSAASASCSCSAVVADPQDVTSRTISHPSSRKGARGSSFRPSISRGCDFFGGQGVAGYE